MANFRQIHVSIWKDNWFLDLEPDEKLLFVYLFSNELASLAGIYKIPLKVIVFETCLEMKFVNTALAKFEEQGKVFYRDGVVWVRNLRKYNKSASPKIQTRIDLDLNEIPDCELKKQYLSYYDLNIPYPYCMDTSSYVMKCNEMNTNENEMEGNEVKEDDADAFQKNPVSAAFVKKTSITPHNLERWIKALDELKEIKAIPEDVEKAIDEMGDKYPVIGLWSVVNATRNVVRKRVGNTRNKRDAPKSYVTGKYADVVES